MSSLNKIEKVIPDIKTVGPSFSVLFDVRQYKKCDVLWLNDRWLYDNGVDSFNEKTRQELKAWLITEYGVGAPSKDQSSQQFFKCPTQMYADRYGGTNGAVHGGSGRCGYRGHFNAKGIGRTPLVSDYIDKGHKNGFMPLSEAISEAIFSEITNIETKYGSIPILAILSTGHKYKFRDDKDVEACAIVVRPNFIRPAHFERSIYFGQSGSKNSEQYIDAIRVKRAIQTVSLHSKKTNIDFNNLEDMFLRFARQVGTGRANRLWQGQFLSSNMSVCGAFVDFGSFRSVYGWQQAVGLSSQVFGKETTSMLAAYESLKFNFDKYLSRPKDYTKEFFLKFKTEISKEIDNSFRVACEKEIISNNGAVAGISPISKILLEYYQLQQKNRYQLSDGSGEWKVRRPWLFHAFKSLDTKKHPYGRQELETAKALRGNIVQLKNSISETEALFLQSLLTWLKPRPSLFHEIMSHKTYLLSRKLIGQENYDTGKVSKFIRKAIEHNRLYWHDKPQGFHVTGQASDGQSIAVFGYLNTLSKPRVWLHGNILGDQVLLFGVKYYLGDLKNSWLNLEGNKITFLLEYKINRVTKVPETVIADALIYLPKAHIH